MKPILFSIGSLHLYSYGFCVALGVLVSLFLMRRRAVLKGGFPSPEQVFDMAFAVLVWGFLGARLFYVIQNFSYYAAEPLKLFAVWEGGLIFYGGAIAAFLALAILSRKHRWPFWKVLDFLSPYAALSHAFGRIGCFLNGCCFGKACELPWAVRFPGLTYPVHPAQLYEAVYDVLLFTYLVKRRDRTRFDGETSLLYFLLYGMGRYLIEFVREPSWTWAGLSSNQWLSVAIMFVAFVLFQKRLKASRHA